MSSSQDISYEDIIPSNRKTDEEEEYVGNKVYLYKKIDSDPSLKMKIRVNLEITCRKFTSNYILHPEKGYI